jgi:hypothetical protein
MSKAISSPGAKASERCSCACPANPVLMASDCVYSSAMWDIASLERIRDRASKLRKHLEGDRMQALWAQLEASSPGDGIDDISDPALAAAARSPGSRGAVSLSTIAHKLFAAAGAAELFAAHSAVCAEPKLFRPLNSGHVLVLERQELSCAEAGGGSGAGEQGAQGAQGQRVQRFVEKVAARLRHEGVHLDVPAPHARAGPQAAHARGAEEGSADEGGGDGGAWGEEDEELLALLERLALGASSALALPRPIYLLLVAYARAVARAGAGSASEGGGGGENVREGRAERGGAGERYEGGGREDLERLERLDQAVVSLLVRLGRWQRGENIHLRRSSHDLEMPPYAEEAARQVGIVSESKHLGVKGLVWRLGVKGLVWRLVSSPNPNT